MGMTDTPYNMPPLGLFGKRCRILTGYDKRPFVYRIVNSELISNTWCEPPITYQSEKNPVRHGYRENVLIVVLDTLVNENSRLIRVALKDVELMDEAPTVGSWISVKDRKPPAISGCEKQFREENDPVLLLAGKQSAIYVGWYIGEDYRWIDCYISRTSLNAYQYITRKITHWMPLPSAKEGD